MYIVLYLLWIVMFVYDQSCKLCMKIKYYICITCPSLSTFGCWFPQSDMYVVQQLLLNCPFVGSNKK